jgi:hypothetical protein
MMMKTVKNLDEQLLEYTLNLDSVSDDGSFKCPKCGISISPDDETEENYKILDTKVLNNELSELLISCNKCSSTIRLATQ